MDFQLALRKSEYKFSVAENIHNLSKQVCQIKINEIQAYNYKHPKPGKPTTIYKGTSNKNRSKLRRFYSKTDKTNLWWQMSG